MSKGKILVVDDEGDLVDLVRMRLQACGYGVEVAACGQETLEKARLFSPHVILLDLVMPEMDGFDVCRTLRASSSVYGSPAVIALSALADEPSVERALATGADSYVVKPFEFRDLLATIEHYIDEKRNVGGVADGSARS